MDTRQGKKVLLRVAVASLLVYGFSVFAGAQAALAISAQVSGSPQSNSIWANGFSPGGQVQFSIRDDGGTLLWSGSRAADSFGNANLNPGDTNNLDLVPGMQIEASQDAVTRSVTLVPLAITGMSPATDVVTGTAVAGTTVVVSVNEGNTPSSSPPVSVVTDGAGNWSADFSGSFDVSAGTHAHAQISEPDGDATVADLNSPTMGAGLACNCISANNFTPGATIEFVIRGAPGGAPLATPSTIADGQGNAWLNPQDIGEIDLVAGMNVQATDGSWAKGVTLAPISITAINVADDSVSGTAPADVTVQVGAGGPGGGTGGQTVATPAGTWTITFAGYDITAMTTINASVQDLDGDSTWVDRQPPNFEAQLHGGLGLHSFAGDVTVTIRSGPEGDVLFQGNFSTDSQGQAWIDRSQIDNVNLVAGMEVDVSDASVTKTLVLDDLTITDIDFEANTVAGTGPADATVFVGVGDQNAQSNQSVTVAGDGTWSVDFSPFDVTPSMGANARTNDADNDVTVANANAPVIRADFSCDCVGGNNFTPDATVTLDILASDQLGAESLYHGSPATDENGNFWVDGETMNGLDLVPGMFVTATQGAHTRSLVIEDVEITSVDVDNDVVAGTAPGPDGRPVGVYVGDGMTGSGGQAMLSNGSWSFDFSPFDVTPAMGANAEIYDPDGDASAFGIGPAPCAVTGPYQCAIDASVTNNWVEAASFTPNSSVTIEIRDAGGGVLWQDTRTTDENGWAWVDSSEHGIDLVPGMRIVATDDATNTTKSLVLDDIAIDTVDYANDTVTGTAPDGPVSVNVDGAGLEVTASGGQWTADFGANGFDLTLGMWVSANTFDADSDATSAEKGPTTIQANITNDWIEGSGFAPNVSVAVEIRSAPGVTPPIWGGTVDTDNSGNFWLDANERWDLTPGQYVRADDGATVKELTLADLTIGSVDLAADVVAGTASAGDEVTVDLWNQNDGASLTATADGSGNWSIDFGGVFDIDNGTGVSARVNDADLDATLVDRNPPVLDVSLTDNWVSGNGFAANHDVDVQIRTAADGSLLWSGTAATDGDGNLWLDQSTHGVDLVAGMFVQGSDGTYTKELTLRPLTVDSVAPAADQISGTATAGDQVEVNLWDNEQEDWLTVAAGDDGTWSADFSGRFDITLTTDVEARVRDDDGDSTVVGHPAARPWISADAGTDTVEVHWLPADTSLTLRILASAGGSQLYTGTAQSDANGDVTVPRTTHGIDLRPGMQVLMTATVPEGTYSKELVIAPLVVKSIDIRKDKVSGTTTPGAYVVVCLDACGEPGEGSGNIDVTADTRGRWSADFKALDPARDIVSGSLVIALQPDSDGDTTSVQKVAAGGGKVRPKAPAASSATVGSASVTVAVPSVTTAVPSVTAVASSVSAVAPSVSVEPAPTAAPSALPTASAPSPSPAKPGHGNRSTAPVTPSPTG